MAAKPAVMQKTSTFMTLVVAPWVSRATGRVGQALRRRPMRPRKMAVHDDDGQHHEDQEQVVEALVGVEVPAEDGDVGPGGRDAARWSART